jgi:hypothetical protein
MGSLLRRALIGGVSLSTVVTVAAAGMPHAARAAFLAPTPVMTLPPGPTTSVPLPVGTLPPGPTYHETIRIYQVSQGPVSAVAQPVLGARLRFQFCFSHSGLSKPRVSLAIYRGQNGPGARVLYRRAMHRGAVSGTQSCFTSTLGIQKQSSVGRDTASFTIWSGSQPIIVFDRMFTIHPAPARGAGKG